MYSQASQDLFVMGILGCPKLGCYLEIGGQHPTEINNTYLLERAGWKGISIDLMDYHGLWSVRKNTFVSADACCFDYKSALHGYPSLLDYLSLDIDEATNTALKALPLDRYMFKVITIEHDAYRHGDWLRKEQRQILETRGYVRICSNVCHSDAPYEDWYVHPMVYNPSQHVKLEHVDHAKVIETYGFETDRDVILATAK